MSKTTFNWEGDDVPNRPPTEEELAAMRQQRFERNWQVLLPMEKQKLACEMHAQLMQLEEKVRLLELIIDQKEEMLQVAIRMGIQQLQFHLPGSPCPFNNFDPDHHGE